MPNTAPIHNQKKRKTNWGKWQKKKGSTTQRGYGYSWEQIKKRIKARDNNLCQSCLRKGRLVEAFAVDHIVPKSAGGGDTDANLECICHPCHKAKTARERLNKGEGRVKSLEGNTK